MNDEEEREYRRRENERAVRERESDALTMMLIGAGVVVLGTGGVIGWGFWGYLNTGIWPPVSLRSIFGWTFTHDMTGLQNIVNWLLDAWLGIYTVALGLLMIYGSNAD